MRTDIAQAVIDAVTGPSSYLMYERLIIEPTRMYFSSYTSGSHPPAFADLEGSPDSPALQAVGVTDVTMKLVTWYNDGGSLKYQIEGSSTLVDTGQSIKGRPGCYPASTRVAWVDASNNLKMAVGDSALLEAHNASPWASGPTDTGFDYSVSQLAVHVPRF